ncbi:aminotransferase class IV [Salinibacterium sp. NSLL150]|uniref:aminotransferase class IV n=1 Tax=unclassified Salinibacterium TaxID=2632331 RepID=UPI0018CFE28A|nr:MULTISPECIES: aminotransferase class IV [unclassified Salinibacterium]MBH0098895.1 aminotransferase class IV [Salinibacterium sp. NSLL35]MBH0101650.1 aminotransferase class IV [Salinibacterium sp. NSLL150]MBH0104409.1 aminotransferase class IV [Salinibacterium sp. NSLL16]MBH0107170.1 aminotransferase class IV [Salinibacterium sp. NSLL17]
MSADAIYRWQNDKLLEISPQEVPATPMIVADSWLVTSGSVLALNLHRQRFLDAVPASQQETADNFFTAAIAALPRAGTWFPRVELRGAEFFLRLRANPELRRSATAASFQGDDPRTEPTVKGPDIDAMGALQAGARAHGADEAILLTEEGYVIEGAYSAVLWWRGEILCGPPTEFERIDSVTARSVLTLARALGLDTHEEAVTPAELEGTEVWVVNALHGIRIVSKWIDGPELAEKPGRLEQWRTRLGALARPI